MNGSRARGTSLGLVAVGLLAASASGPAPLSAQQAAPSDRRALEMYHPYVADLLNAAEAGQKLIYQAVLERTGESPAELDARLYDRIVRTGLAGPDGLSTLASGAPAGDAGRMAERGIPQEVSVILERARNFRRDLLDMVADPSVAQPEQAAEALLRAYLSEAGGALSSEPKDMTLLAENDQAGAFARDYPLLNGLLWAQRWLELAVFEPLLLYRTPQSRQAGVMAVVARYWSMLEEPPFRFPSQIPMAPAIAQNLLAFDVRSAAVLENANMMHERLVDALATEDVGRRAQSLGTALVAFQDDAYRWVTPYAWRQMAMMHGMGNQGGWPIGILPDPEREPVGMDHRHHMMMMPSGMQ